MRCLFLLHSKKAAACFNLHLLKYLKRTASFISEVMFCIFTNLLFLSFFFFARVNTIFYCTSSQYRLSIIILALWLYITWMNLIWMSSTKITHEISNLTLFISLDESALNVNFLCISFQKAIDCLLCLRVNCIFNACNLEGKHSDKVNIDS